jgi:DNA-binding transcriptional regulator YiaG
MKHAAVTRPARQVKRTKRTKSSARKTAVGARLIESLTELRDALASGAPLEERFTVRTVHMPEEPSRYTRRDIKKLREEQLRVSQAVFAKLIGVSAPLVRAWEGRAQRRLPPPMARRLFDQIRQNPQGWVAMVRPKATGAERLIAEGESSIQREGTVPADEVFSALRQRAHAASQGNSRRHPPKSRAPRK